MFSMLQKHTIANAIGPIAGQLKNTNVTFLGQCVGYLNFYSLIYK